MFADLAPRMRARGWSSPIPIRKLEKRPVFHKWQAFNKRPPSDEEFTKWLRIYRNCGVGYAFGLDGVIGADLDWTDPAKAARAWEITKDICGDTPLIRVGRSPKKLALYRYDTSVVIGRKYEGFELFTRSGQCVCFGIHPDTGQPYSWLGESPATLSPKELPTISRKQIVDLVLELEKLDPEAVARRRAGVRKAGLTTEILRQLPEGDEALAKAAELLAATVKGKRHDTLVGAVIALAMRGYSDRVILATLSDAYELVMSGEKGWQESDDEIGTAIEWARERVGPDDETISAGLGHLMEDILAGWNERWGRPA